MTHIQTDMKREIGGDTHRMRLALASKRNFGIGRKLTEAYTTQCNTNKADEKLLLGDNTFFLKKSW